MKYKIGDEAYWNDPDKGVCSGYGTIVDKHGRNGKHKIYILKMKDGSGEVECFQHELS